MRVRCAGGPRVDWVGVALVACLLGTPRWTQAQAAPGPPPRTMSIHRPWVGFGGGWGSVLGTGESATGGLLSMNLDVRLDRAASVRVVAERLWSTHSIHGGLSVRQLSADLLLRHPIRTLGRCGSELVYGAGAGVFGFAFDDAALNDDTKIGYEIDVGGECVGGRLATGVALGWRFVDAPKHPMFTNSTVTSLNLTFTVRFRL